MNISVLKTIWDLAIGIALAVGVGFLCILCLPVLLIMVLIQDKCDVERKP